MGQAMSNGVCWLHSGRSHVMSPEGAARKSQKARDHMTRMWAEHWGPNGRNLTDEGRMAISAAQKRRWAAVREKHQRAESPLTRGCNREIAEHPPRDE
jgi:hypothetical protein